jgi:hypothetical protein
VAASAGYAAVLDTGVDGTGTQSTVYLYTINAGATASAADASYTAIAPIQTAGQAIAINGACGAVGNPNTGQVTLFPVDNPPTDICCTGPSCATVATASCPKSATQPTITIPTLVHVSANATVNTNCTTSLLGPALLSPSTSTCASVSFPAQDIQMPGAIACFPRQPSTFPNILKCEPLPRDMSGQVTCLQSNTCCPQSGTDVPVLYQDPTSKRYVGCCTNPFNQTTEGNNQCATGIMQFSSFVQGGIKDSDGDFVADPVDNCVAVQNLGQADTDRDRVGDACDNCPNTPNQNQAYTTGTTIPVNGQVLPVGDACNCALPGVKTDFNGRACPANAGPVPTPAMGPRGAMGFGVLLLVAGVAANRRRKAC